MLKEVKAVFQVEGDSALPLALDKQKILCGIELPIHELYKKTGQIVALRMENGEGQLKRIGKPIPGYTNLLVLESVGAEGQAIVASLDGDERPGSRLPVVAAAREVLGVIYHRGSGHGSIV
jgi:hypothetical protein